MEDKKNGKERKKGLNWAISLLEKYFKGELDAKSTEKLRKWNPEEIGPIYEASEEEIYRSREKVKENLFRRLGIEDPDKNEEPQNKRKGRAIFNLLKYATAAVIAGLIITGGYFAMNRSALPPSNYLAKSNEEIVIEAGKSIRVITLPDSTRLHINIGSIISYNKSSFNHRKREVRLEGEAFFDVAKNPDKPFIIYTDKLTTTVKGTSFNIKAYKELEENSISVRNGLVEISDGEKKLTLLTINEQLTYNTAKNQFKTETVRWQNAAEWIRGGFVLNYVGPQELAMRIKQYYGKNIEIRDHALDNIRMKSSFAKGTGFENVIRTLCELYHVKYSWENDKIILYK
ncbi:FecR family protein [Parabacteroides sp. Marseille-P3160]|uniref:FecR family protein n=1 Tax=Parabacteroides sp. Marseille-P3160 TaxID=1917887 RepID=UPI0009BAF133|nr:FecR family protein [Parabacteroides sp. Marseille-P3160]